jgi:hypothetical protein
LIKAGYFLETDTRLFSQLKQGSETINKQLAHNTDELMRNDQRFIDRSPISLQLRADRGEMDGERKNDQKTEDGQAYSL